MTNIRKAFLLLSTVLSYGCHTIYYPSADVDEAVLYSPEGKFEFNIDEKLAEKRYAATFSATDGSYEFNISLFPVHKKSIIKILPKPHSIKINSENTYYQLNGGEKITLVLSISRNLPYIISYDIAAPETMDYFSTSGGELSVFTHGKGMHKPGSEARKKMENETYRYHIAFYINDQPYVIDTTFRLDSSITLTIGVPVTP